MATRLIEQASAVHRAGNALGKGRGAGALLMYFSPSASLWRLQAGADGGKVAEGEDASDAPLLTGEALHGYFSRLAERESVPRALLRRRFTLQAGEAKLWVVDCLHCRGGAGRVGPLEGEADDCGDAVVMYELSDSGVLDMWAALDEEKLGAGIPAEGDSRLLADARALASARAGQEVSLAEVSKWQLGDDSPLELALFNCVGGIDYVPHFRWMFDSIPGPREVVLSVYQAADMACPPRHAWARLDGAVVSGSAAGVYEAEEKEWIGWLAGVVRDMHSAGLPLAGLCFGHQLLAAALGSMTDAVTKMPDGMFLGAREMKLQAEGRDYLLSLLDEVPAAADSALTSDMLRLRYIHGDEVVALPDGMRCLGSHDRCDYLGMYDGSSVLTFQGHPEFTAEATVEILGLIEAKGRAPACLREGETMESVYALAREDVDALFTASCIYGLFARARKTAAAAAAAKEG